MSTTRNFTDSGFQQEVLESSQPVVVDVWAPWCGPCKAVGPVIDELAQEFDGRVTIGKLNVDENPEIAGRFNISSIPTVLVFHGGQVVERLVGAQAKATYARAIENAAA